MNASSCGSQRMAVFASRFHECNSTSRASSSSARSSCGAGLRISVVTSPRRSARRRARRTSDRRRALRWVSGSAQDGSRVMNGEFGSRRVTTTHFRPKARVRAGMAGESAGRRPNSTGTASRATPSARASRAAASRASRSIGSWWKSTPSITRRRTPRTRFRANGHSADRSSRSCTVATHTCPRHSGSAAHVETHSNCSMGPPTSEASARHGSSTCARSLYTVTAMSPPRDRSPSRDYRFPRPRCEWPRDVSRWASSPRS